MDEFDRDMGVYGAEIRGRALDALKDDVAGGDVTTDALFDSDVTASSVVIAKTSCVLAGILEARAIFEGGGVSVVKSKADGGEIRAGGEVMRLKGTIKEILKRERTALNYMQRMSGIATKSRELSKKWKKRVSFLRKCDPGLLYSEKRAVSIGGCMTHRVNLSDGCLIKDNHLVALHNESPGNNAIMEAIRRSARSGCRFVEIEVSTKKDACTAAQTFKKLGLRGAIMLDNMSVKDAKVAVDAIRAIDKKVIVEASGGITEEKIGEYLRAGVDFVSTSIFVTNALKVDMSLELLPEH